MHHSQVCSLSLKISLIVLLFSPLSLSQTTPPPPQLSKLSDKDLFKKATADDKAGSLESAREAISLVVERAIQKKKKPDKKYQDLLDSLNTRLADREAAAGEAACGRMDLAACQKQIAAAKNFATTQNVTQLETTFSNTLTKLRQEFQVNVALADGGDPESALDNLAKLARFEAFLPNIKSETERVRGLFLQKLVDEGKIAIDEQRWEDASMRFQRVLAISPNYEQARAGLEKVERGRKAYLLSSQAAEQLKGQHYEEAFKSIGTALVTYPEAKREFEQAQKQISQAWVNYLLETIPPLLENQDDLQKSREAYLRLQKVMELDPGRAEAPKLFEKAKQVFVLNSAEYAQKLAEIKDLSRIATATVLKYDIQTLMPDLISQEEMKGAMGNFNRKRVSQLVLSVEDLVLAAPDFTKTIQALTRSSIEKQGLRDLRLRSKDDYEKSPNDDLQFQYLLPDGKSYNAVLTVNITKYDFRQIPTTSDVKSRYRSGTEKVANPEYDALLKLVDQMSKALNNPSRKKGKPTKEGWTEVDYERKSKELDRTDKFIEQDKVSDYTYQRTEHEQNTDIEVEVILRDFYSKEVIDQKKIQYHLPRKAVEITGVKEDKDVNGLQNQPHRLPEKDQALAEGSRAVREGLDKAIPQLLRSYTDRFFNEGEKSLKAGRIDDAVEAYLCHWAFYGGHIEPAQMERIAEIIKGATAFDVKKDGEKLMAELLKVPVIVQ